MGWAAAAGAPRCGLADACGVRGGCAAGGGAGGGTGGGTGGTVNDKTYASTTKERPINQNNKKE